MIEELLNKLFNDSIIEDINREDYTTVFKLPIELIPNKYSLSENIVRDLELLNNADSDKHSLYHNTFGNDTLFGSINLDMWSKYYTNDVSFLTESQNLYTNYRDISINEDEYIKDDDILNISTEIIEDDSFIERFHYIDLPMFKEFNKNETILQLLAYQNLSSPLFAVIMPILMLIVPFFIIKIQGHEITLERYMEFIKTLLGNHIIGQLFSNFSDAPMEKKIYLIFSFGLFLFQIYNNINTCKNYYHNIKYIHDTLNTVRLFLTNTTKKIDNFLKYSNDLLTYKNFNEELLNRKCIVENYLISINKIGEYNFNIKKVMELGYLMKCFYILNNSNELTEAIKYYFGFTGYIENINKLQYQIENKNMNFCNFIDNDKVVTIKNCYFAALNNKNPVKNNIKLNNNIIITGPNAAGKTTLLKSVLYNIILSQQIGCGFYSKADIKVYDYIHCYINIPETSDRDSLFQAECRNCKNILDKILENPDKNHFCVFDELYSGTNPYEAIASGYSYLDYISKYKNINFVLTTHYIKLCKLLKSKTNNNHYMEINTSDISSNYTYTYKLVPGISEIKGGIKVLKDLEYPETIVNNMNETIDKITI